MNEPPYQPFYKPYGMSDEEYAYECQIAAEKLAQWEQEQEEIKLMEEQKANQHEPQVSLPKPEILILFRKLYQTDNPEYVDCYTDYDLAYTEMLKKNQADPQRNYYLESVIPKARSN